MRTRSGSTLFSVRARRDATSLLLTSAPELPRSETSAQRSSAVPNMEHSSASWDEYQSQRQFNQDPRNFHPTPVPMSGASDKARFYLEQTVPELQELKRKQIFTEVGGMAFAVLRRS